MLMATNSIVVIILNQFNNIKYFEVVRKYIGQRTISAYVIYYSKEQEQEEQEQEEQEQEQEEQKNKKC